MEGTQNKCLNCNQPLSGKFCSNCGQRSNTHRITAQHFITHDLVHGVWHVDRGLFYTIKESVFRAGKASMEYIEGKRIKYYNVFYLALLLLGANLLLQHYTSEMNSIKLNSAGEMTPIAEFLKRNIKIIILLFIPVISIIGFLIFKKSKLNLAEHAIIAGFLFCGLLIMSIMQNLLYLLPVSVVNVFEYSLFPLIYIVQLIFPGWVYYQAISKRFSKIGFFIRLLFFYLLTLIMYFFVLIVIILLYNYVITGTWEMEGQLNFESN